jgi:hypothetical protein
MLVVDICSRLCRLPATCKVTFYGRVEKKNSVENSGAGMF